MVGQHIAKTQKWPVSIQLKKAGQEKASWPVSIKHFFAKHQLTLLLGRSQHVDPFIFYFCLKQQDKHCISHYDCDYDSDYDKKIRYKFGPIKNTYG